MKKIFNILMLAAVVALTSCNYEPEGWHGTVFDGNSDEVVFDRTSINYAFGPEEGTAIQIPVSRGIATEAYTTHIQILDAEGNPIMSNPDYALMAIEQAKFEVDQYEAVATLTFDRRQFVAGTAVNFILAMHDTQIDSDVTMCALTILRDYTWSEYCGATLVSGFWSGLVGIAEVPCVVYKAEGFPYYRVYDDLTGLLNVEVGFNEGVLSPRGIPDSYGDVEFETGVGYITDLFLRYVNIDPEATYYAASANAIVAISYYLSPGDGAGGTFQDIWYCDKPLVTE